MYLLLIILLILLVIGGLPQTGFHPFGYYPSGIGLILVIVLIFVLLR